MKNYADIFIPTSKNEVVLDKCLASLEKQSNKNFRVILVSFNNSSELDSVCKKFHSLRILHLVQKKRGILDAANLALKHANKKIFVRIDDDVTVTPYWFENIVRSFTQNENIGGVTGPTWLTEEGKKSRDSIAFLSETKSDNFLTSIMRHFYLDYLYEGKLYKTGIFLRSGNFSIGSNFREHTKYVEDVMNFEACNFAVRRDLIVKMGGFDRLFERGLSDYHEADIACKIRALGYRIIFNPKASVVHHIESDTMTSRPDTYHRIQNFIFFYKRHIGIKNPDYLLRFLANVFSQNMYYCYKFIKTGDISQLGALPGSIIALLSHKK